MAFRASHVFMETETERTFFQNTSLLMAVANRDLVIEAVNPAWKAAFTHEAGSGPGAWLGDILPRELIDAIASGPGRPHRPFELPYSTSHVKWVEADLAVVQDHVVAVLIDISDSVARIQAVEEARRAQDLLLHDASVGTWRYDPVAEVFEFSPELRSLLPRPENDRPGAPTGVLPRALVVSMFHPDDVLVEAAVLERLVREGGTGGFELRVRNLDAEGWHYVKLLLRGGRDLAPGRHEVYGLTQRITELAGARDEARANADRIRALAGTDALSGVANRMSFDEQLERTVASARSSGATFSLMYIDLDRFKKVNDTLGHGAGDELIQEAARRLLSVCRAGDIVARLGGDEFVLLQVGMDAQAAAATAQRVVSVLSGAVELSSGRATLSCSVGVALAGQPAPAGSEVVRRADLALYRAKAQGRGRFCFYVPEMEVTLGTRRAV